MIEIKKPFIGAAYYPEDWDESEIDKDIAQMLEIGINVVRIGEFAWAKMEPSEGNYDFTWLHNVVDKLQAAGIGVIMGTPTAAPPYWLTSKDKDMFVLREHGQRIQHGGRRFACSNNPTYLDYCDKIVTALAKEFGKDEAIIGWQIDNEIYLQRCHCEHCNNKFRKHLKDKFGTVEELNKRWNLNIFSQIYNDFDEISTPKQYGNWHNPFILFEYKRADANTQIEFINRQAEILKKYVDAPIGTDQMPFNGINYRKMHEKLDVIQFNHYNTPDNLWETCLWMDYLRTLKDTPFWNTETATNWSGDTGAAGSIKPYGFCYANSWLPVVLGGESNMYWLWRTHWAAHELVHGSVLESSGRPTYCVSEVTKVSKEFEKAADFINDTKVVTEVAMHYTSINWSMFETQKVVNDFNFDKVYKNNFYKPIIDSGLRPDVIDGEADLSKYNVIFTPLMLTLDEFNMRKDITDWVNNGGIWVTGPMTDIRTGDGTRYTDRLHGMLEKLTPAYNKYWAPDVEKRLQNKWNDGTDFGGNYYYEMFTSDSDADIVNIVSGNDSVIGDAIVQKYKVGKGYIYILGTVPDYNDMRRIISDVCNLASVECNITEGNSIIVSKRKGESRNGIILAEIAGIGGVYHNDKTYTDILTGKTYINDITLAPYQVLVLE